MHDQGFKRRRHTRGLWNAGRKALSAAIALLCLAVTAGAQAYPNGLSVDSADPEADSVFIREARAKMALIRVSQHRPTVAVVMSGGGAKGAATVGALKYIEELGIPVDLVTGTSIGGLAAGLYSVGYRSDDLAALFREQDWSTALTDKVDSRYIPYSTKMRNSTYIASIPFSFTGKILAQGGNGNEELRTQAGISALTSSLPSGYAYGFNINNLFSSLTVGFQDSLSFSSLPIPFACVAADVVSCKAKNWGSGSITKALRSTMSIPGLFEPVRTDGMVLVDGGTRNNFPADLARAMGADIIIGINLADARPGYEEVNNLGDILGQFITMLGQDAYDKNIDTPDVIIKPNLPEFDMMSFSREAVDTMLVRGYDAAAAQKDALLELKSRLNGVEAAALTRHATDISRRPVEISEIEFEGLSEGETKAMARLIEFKPGMIVYKDDIDKAMSKMQATGALESVTYSLYGTGSPYRLVFHCATASPHVLGVSGRIDSEEWASLLFNIGINTHKLMGSTFEFTAKLGQNLKGDFRYGLALPGIPTINFEASVSRYKGELGNATSMGDDTKYGVSYLSHKEMLYLTDVKWTKYNFQFGLRNQYDDIDDKTVLGKILSQETGSSLHGDYIGAFLNGHFYTFDDWYYPSKGSNVAFDVAYDFLKPGESGFKPILSVGVDMKFVWPFGDNFAMIPAFHIRNIFNNNEHTTRDGEKYTELSALHCNFAGGAIQGRYTDNQVPFFGINNILLVDEMLATGTMEMRFNPYKSLYLSAMAGAMLSGDTFTDVMSEVDPYCWALGAEAAYNLITGPFKVNLHWSSAQHWGIYLSLGFDF